MKSILCFKKVLFNTESYNIMYQDKIISHPRSWGKNKVQKEIVRTFNKKTTWMSMFPFSNTSPTFYKFQKYNEKIRMIWENLHIIISHKSTSSLLTKIGLYFNIFHKSLVDSLYPQKLTIQIASSPSTQGKKRKKNHQ